MTLRDVINEFSSLSNSKLWRFATCQRKTTKINKWLFARQKEKIKFFGYHYQIHRQILHRITFLAHTAVRVLIYIMRNLQLRINCIGG